MGCFGWGRLYQFTEIRICLPKRIKKKQLFQWAENNSNKVDLNSEKKLQKAKPIKKAYDSFQTLQSK